MESATGQPAQDAPPPESAGVIGDFQAGPSATELIAALSASLRKWALRPWSIWHGQLVERAWTPLRAHVVMRCATALWVLAVHMFVAACAGGLLWGLGQLVAD